MAQRLASRGEINGDAVDRFTFVHAGFGALMGAVNTPLWLAVTVAVGWELVERPLKNKFPHWFPNATQDRMVNLVVDAGAMMAGYGAARALKNRED